MKNVWALPIKVTNDRLNFTMKVDEDVDKNDILKYNTILTSLIKVTDPDDTNIAFKAVYSAKAGDCCVVTRYSK